MMEHKGRMHRLLGVAARRSITIIVRCTIIERKVRIWPVKKYNHLGAALISCLSRLGSGWFLLA
jgi:hypothetical protein